MCGDHRREGREQVGGRGDIIDLRMGETGGRKRCRSINQLYKRGMDERNPSHRGGNVYQILGGATYKVLSFGMWLKLATDSRLMLLLLSVLRREKEQKTTHRFILQPQGRRTQTEKWLRQQV